MLLELRVENLGIISELQLVIGPGMTAITGETGAGKTLIVEALELLLGGRADANLIRSGTEEARAEARFEIDGDEIVLARVLPANGRSRAYIDGRLATAGELADIGRRVVDLHGQHDQQSLLHGAEQRSLLDSYAGQAAHEHLATIRRERSAMAAVTAELADLGGDERARAREIDLLQFQIEEIAAATISDSSEEELLIADIERLGDAEAHREALTNAFASVDSASDSLGSAVGVLSGRAPLCELEQQARDAQALLSELSHEIRVATEAMVADPGRLAELTTRRQLLRELRRKYGDTLAEVIAFEKEASARHGALIGHADRVRDLERQRNLHEDAARHAAQALHDERVLASVGLATDVTAHLQALALAGATFSIDVQLGELSDDGMDTVTFLLAPNKGEPARPLAKAASGGELSRTMLAIRVVLSQAPPTLVFDEVDSGIGGEVGIAIGAALRGLGRRHQVLCVTHLAQVAAAADAQVHVSKTEREGRTVSKADVLNDPERIEELARMLGGATITKSARAHAGELLATQRVALTAERPS